MTFNTVYPDLRCPYCEEAIVSGVGFCVGAIGRFDYRIGDRLRWEGSVCRPVERPVGGNIKSVGYFNCDNMRCKSWMDCFPLVQQALITVENDVITAVELFDGQASDNGFDIIEPKGLS